MGILNLTPDSFYNGNKHNLSGYFNYNTYYVVKDFAQFTSLSNHIIDKNSLKVNWDPAYDDYQIK